MLETTKRDFEEARLLVRREFEREGEIAHPYALLRYHEAGEVRRRRLDTMVLVLGEDGEPAMRHVGKDMFVQAVRHFTAHTNAEVCILVMEAWVATTEAKTVEGARAERARYQSVEDMPDCREAVCLYVEDAGGTELWQAAILRGDGTARLTDFVNTGAEVREGAMTRLLPHLQQQNCN